MEFIRADVPTPFVEFVANSIDTFTLIDIGCAGGIDPAWRQFGSRLHAWGFDAMLDEVSRLQAGEASETIHYIAGFVGSGAPWAAPERDPSARLSYQSTIQARAGKRWTMPPSEAPRRYVHPTPDLTPSGDISKAAESLTLDAETRDKARLENRWHETETSARSIVIDDFLAKNGVNDIDFIKIDVDGPDWDILNALGPVLKSSQVIGVAAEVNFFGSENLDGHFFHNTDRFMRAAGFELFKLSTRQYSSAALPSPYLYRIPAQTASGRPLQGDAVYLRDFGWILDGAHPDAFSAQKHAKLAALFALFNLPCMAAETLLRARPKLRSIMDVEAGLDILAKQVGVTDSYRQHMALFRTNDPRFYNATGSH